MKLLKTINTGTKQVDSFYYTESNIGYWVYLTKELRIFSKNTDDTYKGFIAGISL